MARTTRDRILKKIKQYWPNVDPQEILCVLDEYGAKSSERGRVRVQLAVLKLSGGERERLPDLVKMAKRDYRDVLAYAEYPEQMRIGFVGMSELSPKEREKVRRRDRKQYLKWLGR